MSTWVFAIIALVCCNLEVFNIVKEYKKYIGFAVIWIWGGQEYYREAVKSLFHSCWWVIIEAPLEERQETTRGRESRRTLDINDREKEERTIPRPRYLCGKCYMTWNRSFSRQDSSGRDHTLLLTTFTPGSQLKRSRNNTSITSCGFDLAI